jgi:hypothetical protein
MKQARTVSRSAIGLLVTGILVVGGSLTAGAAEVHPVNASGERVFTDEEAKVLEAEVQAVIDQDPQDYVAIQAKVEELYGAGEEIRVSVEGSDQTLTPEEAVEAIAQSEERARQSVAAANAAARSAGAMAPAAIPVDFVTLSFAFIPRPTTGIDNWWAQGSWKFAQNYYGSGDPDDFASNTLDLGCAILYGSTTGKTYNDAGGSSGQWYLRDSGLTTKSPVIGINDDGNQVYAHTTHSGYILTPIAWQCGPSYMRGAFVYEHNKGGGSVLSVSANLGFITVGYQTVEEHTQRSTGIVQTNG